METELSGRGVDVDKIKKLDAQIVLVEAELTFIEQNRKLVFGYQKDKEELFDNENLFRQQKQELDNKREQLDEKYNLRHEKLQRQKHDTEQLLIAQQNSYLHFGDIDLAGIHIYQTEFYAKLGNRAAFLIPSNIETFLKKVAVSICWSN